MQDRTRVAALTHWLLLDANRWLLISGLTAGCFAVLLVAGTIGVPLRTVMSQTDTVETVFQTLTAAVITGTTLVVSINQLVLSQEFGSIGRQRDQMDKSMTFRGDVEHIFGSIGPPEPDTFLQRLVDQTTDQAKTLRQAVADNTDPTLRDRIDQFVERIVDSADDITAELEDAQFGEFTVLRASLAYNYSWRIYLARRLRLEHDDALSESEREAFDGLIEILELFGPAGEFFKAHYLQWELVNLSRQILYTAVPALLVTVLAALHLQPTTARGGLFGIDNMVWLVSAGVTLALVPFFVFIAYVLRITTIGRVTGAIGPFVLHESERAPLIDWDE